MIPDFNYEELKEKSFFIALIFFVYCKIAFAESVNFALEKNMKMYRIGKYILEIITGKVLDNQPVKQKRRFKKERELSSCFIMFICFY